MNKEVIKAMNKKETAAKRFSKWWSKNGYKVMRVVLFPIWSCVWAHGKIKNHLYAQLEWSEKRAHRILSYYVPRFAHWDAEDKSFYFADNGLGWSMTCHRMKVKLRDRSWWKKYTSGWGGKVRTYLLEKFELEGFIKEVGDTDDSWTEITFHLIEK